jgi:hypothetical protein
MGRYYGGDIVGKFWFGIQSSDDARHFGVNPSEPELLYWNCGTFCEPTVPADTPCPSCDPEKECVARECNQITFSFNREDLPRVEEVLQILEETVLSEYSEWAEVQNLLKNDNTWQHGTNEEWISNEVYDRLFEFKNLTKKLTARYMLGTQIKRCLTVKGSCTFWCEL